MIAVKVSYTVPSSFVARNKENIAQFLKDFQQLDTALFSYSVFLCEDGKTFLHMSTYKNEEIQTRVLNVPSFKKFQEERDQSGLDDSHKVEMLHPVGSSFNV
ncbi:hypothetical protein [Flavobacterium humi]|uniref:ABM domain-containing protein n=1 Tax=Flavobacterium humi TaxID=2562683 RepID=A0A4Z0L331_9FLAO|nr:hypothetical protein [Flavobacterium humi]TGD56638.1 hypothetical protein E4635_14425 [Flavobacterium humi]